MNKALTIQEFNSILQSEKTNSPLLAALRKITTIKSPAEVIVNSKNAPTWYGWQ